MGVLPGVRHRSVRRTTPDTGWLRSPLRPVRQRARGARPAGTGGRGPAHAEPRSLAGAHDFLPSPSSPAAGVAAVALLVGGCSGGAADDQPAAQEPVAAVDADPGRGPRRRRRPAGRPSRRRGALRGARGGGPALHASREGAEDGRRPEEVAREVEDVVTELSLDLTASPRPRNPRTTRHRRGSSGSSGSTSGGSMGAAGARAAPAAGTDNGGQGQRPRQREGQRGRQGQRAAGGRASERPLAQPAEPPDASWRVTSRRRRRRSRRC
jgi:hypothetical protein